jgi:hypothetical protein
MKRKKNHSRTYRKTAAIGRKFRRNFLWDSGANYSSLTRRLPNYHAAYFPLHHYYQDWYKGGDRTERLMIGAEALTMGKNSRNLEICTQVLFFYVLCFLILNIWKNEEAG